MEKVFAMDTGEKFDVARLGSPSESAGSDRERERGPPSRYGDRDFNRAFFFILFLFIFFFFFFSFSSALPAKQRSFCSVRNIPMSIIPRILGDRKKNSYVNQFFSRFKVKTILLSDVHYLFFI